MKGYAVTSGQGTSSNVTSTERPRKPAPSGAPQRIAPLPLIARSPSRPLPRPHEGPARQLLAAVAVRGAPARVERIGFVHYCPLSLRCDLLPPVDAHQFKPNRLVPIVLWTDYKYDGTTTYCYWMDQGMQVSNFDFAYVLQEGTGADCPLTVSLQQATSGTIVPGSEVEYAFTATLNLNDNSFNLTELQTTVPDPTTGLPMQIGHANIHTCSRSTVCDIFRTGSNRKIADQETSNFTSSGTASFRQKITYTSAGERNVFAHIILPPKDYLEESYHFITFITTTVEASTSSTADEESSGLSTGATVGMVVGGVAIVVAVILSVVFWRRKRVPGEGTDHFRNSGFGLPASYVASKSKSHLDWNAEPEQQGSGWKDNYSSRGGRSNGSRGPGLDASALAFNDRLSRQNKTVSSSGSLHSSRGPGDSGIMYNNYDTPMQRSGNGRSARDPFNRSQSMYPDDSMYDDGESRIIEEDPNLEYGRTPDLETFGIHQGPSFESETSMGTSFEYNTDVSHFAQPAFNPLLSGYGPGRESDLSSMGETDDYNMYEQPPQRKRGDTLDAMLIAPEDEGSENGDIRDGSVSSIGTVDFTQDEPSVRSQKPITFEPLDETLTLSGYAKAQTASPDFSASKSDTNFTNTSDFANSNSSDNTEFIVHDRSTEFATSNASTDFASTASSVDIDGNKMNFGSTANTTNDYASNIASTEFGASTATDIVSNSDFTSEIASTNLSASSAGDFTKPSSHSDFDEGSSLSSDLEGSSYNSDLTGSSYGTDITGNSYGSSLTGNSYNTHLDDSALDAAATKSDLSNTQSTYDFDDKSYRASGSFATTASDDTVKTDEGLRIRRVSSADGESYEF